MHDRFAWVLGKDNSELIVYEDVESDYRMRMEPNRTSTVPLLSTCFIYLDFIEVMHANPSA